MENKTVTNNVFRSWCPDWLAIIMYTFCLIPYLMMITLYNASISFSASFLDIEPEDMQFMISLMYGMIVVTLLIQKRLFAFLPIRNYILLAAFGSLFVLFLISQVHHYAVLVFLRILQGGLGLVEGLGFTPLINARFKNKNAVTYGYLCLFGIVLTCGTFTANIIYKAVDTLGWREMLYLTGFFHLIVLAVAITTLKSNRMQPKKPLYQVDWASCVLLMFAVHSGAFVVIYGHKLYWFQSGKIWTALFICMVSSGLFILKQFTTKHNLFSFNVLRYKKVVKAMFLFFILYVVRSATGNIYSIMTNVYKWPLSYVLHIQYFETLGVLIGMVPAAIMLLRKVNVRWIFGGAFLCFIIACRLMTHLVYTDTSLVQIVPVLLLIGVGSGWLFTPLAMYMILAVPTQYTTNSALMGTTTRYWTTNIGFALMLNARYYFTREYYMQNMGSVSGTNPIAKDRIQQLTSFYQSHNYSPDQATHLAMSALNNEVNNQGLLISTMKIYDILFWLCILVFLWIMFFINQSLRDIISRLRAGNNEYFENETPL